MSSLQTRQAIIPLRMYLRVCYMLMSNLVHISIPNMILYISNVFYSITHSLNFHRYSCLSWRSLDSSTQFFRRFGWSRYDSFWQCSSSIWQHRLLLYLTSTQTKITGRSKYFVQLQGKPVSLDINTVFSIFQGCLKYLPPGLSQPVQLIQIWTRCKKMGIVQIKS